MAHARDLEGRGIDATEHVEIEETVIQRRHQRIGHRMRKPHQVGVVAGRIDHDEIVAVLDLVDRGREASELGGFILVDANALAARYAVVIGHFKHDASALRAVATILDIVREGLLPAVEIDGGDALPGLEQRHRDMHRGR
jgi:hypothetical protein